MPLYFRLPSFLDADEHFAALIWLLAANGLSALGRETAAARRVRVAAQCARAVIVHPDAVGAAPLVAAARLEIAPAKTAAAAAAKVQGGRTVRRKDPRVADGAIA